MAITKKEISEVVLDLVSRGDQASEDAFDPRIVYKIVEVVRNSLIEQAFYSNRESNGLDINGDFITTFKDVPVLNDADRNEKYAELPSKIVSLRDNRGLRQVGPMQDPKSSFTLIASGSNAIWCGLEAEACNPYTQMYIDGDRLYFSNLPPSIDKLLIKMIASVDNLDENEPIPIPGNAEESLLDRVLAKLNIPRTVEGDDINDANSNIG